MRKLAIAMTSVALVGAAVVTRADVKVKTAHDKTFNFKGLSTWAWHPEGIGDVKVLQNTKDDAAELKAKFEPVFIEAVEAGFTARRLSKAAAGPADLYVNYYLLIGPGISAQTMGQFMPPVAYWGLPPFAPATSAIAIYEQGSLVIDVSSVKQGSIVWRGLAIAEVDRGRTPEERARRIRDGIASVMKKFPETK